MPTRTYKISNGRVNGWIDDLEAMRQAVEKILLTERFEWVIYSDNYGIEIQELIGNDFDLIQSEIERVVGEALLADERIESVDNFDLQQTDRSSLLFSFTVLTVFGEINMEQEVVA
ncbi:DUF2634 domain-containing protein [Enterococcus asini]|uniref:DUF2634 domain-containing protein n=1 Tax=Enterococcus asini TaxID=57732 RepID=UPI0028907829|nr:DUF2634 domain-containing protein [Enterococcus asini]MDT2757358.1 DUF2634 domain-containing protein [Enterococcus asini]